MDKDRPQRELIATLTRCVIYSHLFKDIDGMTCLSFIHRLQACSEHLHRHEYEEEVIVALLDCAEEYLTLIPDAHYAREILKELEGKTS